MSDFPTLSRQPIVGGVTETLQDDVIWYEPEAGPDVTRISNTRPYKEFALQWVALTATDIGYLRTWWDAYRATFTTWTYGSTTWSVRPKGPYQVAGNSQSASLYDVSMVLRGWQLT